ncbi:hypothetical protein BD311DRAFT_812732, partial [Dichomitus squalens]
MPTLDHTSLLLTLFVDMPHVVMWPNFQALTQLTVVPFSPECTAQDLEMEEEAYQYARAFVAAWKTKQANTSMRDDMDGRLKFMRGKLDQWHEGRNHTRQWLSQKWDEWAFSEVVTEVFEAAGYDTWEFHKRNGAQEWMSADDAEIYRVFRPLAVRFFGQECLLSGDGMVNPKLKPFIKALAYLNWEKLSKRWTRALKQLRTSHHTLVKDLEKLKAHDSLTLKEITSIIGRIKNIITKGMKFGLEEVNKITE